MQNVEISFIQSSATYSSAIRSLATYSLAIDTKIAYGKRFYVDLLNSLVRKIEFKCVFMKNIKHIFLIKLETYILSIGGDNDYAALYFKEYHSNDKIIDMIRNVLLNNEESNRYYWTIEHDDEDLDWFEQCTFELELYVFGPVDISCIALIHNNFLDYDDSKTFDFLYYTEKDIFPNGRKSTGEYGSTYDKIRNIDESIKNTNNEYKKILETIF